MSSNNNNDLMRILGALEGGQKQILEEIRGHHDRMNRIDENVEGIEERLRGVEKKQYTVFVIATAAWTCIVGWIVKNFG